MKCVYTWNRITGFHKDQVRSSSYGYRLPEAEVIRGQ